MQPTSTCSDCGASLFDDDAFCASCGAPHRSGHPDVGVSRRGAHQRGTAAGRTCSSCYAPLLEGDEFCAVCGARAAQPEETRPGGDRDLYERLGREIENRYDLINEIGRGGMGVVYKARDRELGRVVAVKLLSPDLTSDTAMVERFRREARTLATLRHEGIVNVYEVDEAGPLIYFVMDYIDGASLTRILRERGALPIDVVQAILYQVATALSYAHGYEREIIHRDLKPSNIHLDRSGRAVVMDFGIAKDTARETGLTRTGMIVGTPEYMSPEQARGGTVTAASDQYSLGTVAFAMLTGAPPFTGPFYEVLMGHQNEPPADLREVVPACPPTLAEGIARMLAKRPEERFPSLDDALEAMRLDPIPKRAPVWDELRRLAEIGGGDPGHPPPQPDAPTVADSTTDHATGGGELGAFTQFFGLEASQGHGGSVGTGGATQPGTADGGTVMVPHAGLTKQHSHDLPRQLGRYTLHDFMAEGRTGRLYVAYDPVRKQLVGLKVLHNRDGLAQQRLLRGAGHWIELRHPNVLRILDVDLGTDRVPPYVVTELVEGTDLGRLLTQRDLDLKERISIVVQLCDAVEYLHESGIIHREIKPKNILVTLSTMHVTLLDAGVARPAGGGPDDLTRIGIPVGDPEYMAPEQRRGRPTQRSDVFAIGVVLSRLLIGEDVDATDLDTVEARLEASGLPERLTSAAGKALARDPAARFSSASELGDRLRAFVPDPPSDSSLRSVVATLHGIRTHGGWQRTFTEAASAAGLDCRLDKWNYGWFSTFRFLLPWARRGRVKWFRSTYRSDFGDRGRAELTDDRPSIVAHSFGTYILGNALLTYPYLRFNKIILCGSILPRDFPWDALIDRGQVQAVRNEYGTRDLPTRIVQWFVTGTGPSGIDGFTAEHDRLHQERFTFSHSEYFERGHMLNRWVPFLKAREAVLTPCDCEARPPKANRPWGLYAVYAAVVAVVVMFV